MTSDGFTADTATPRCSGRTNRNPGTRSLPDGRPFRTPPAVHRQREERPAGVGACEVLECSAEPRDVTRILQRSVGPGVQIVERGEEVVDARLHAGGGMIEAFRARDGARFGELMNRMNIEIGPFSSG